MNLAVHKDEILAELQRVLKIKQEKLVRFLDMHKAARASELDVNAVQEEIARARIELKEWEGVIKENAGGEMINDWNRELAEIAINAAEFEARQQKIIEELATIKEQNLLDRATQYEMDVSSRIDVVFQNYRDAQQHVMELERLLAELTPPTVSLIGQEN